MAFGEPIIVPAPEGVDRAISEVMARHQDELDAALEPFDVSLDTLVQATWMRFVTVADVVALGSNPDLDAAPWRRYARGELTYDEAVQLGGPLEEPVPEDSLAARLSSPSIKREPGVPMGEQIERSLPLLGAPRSGGSTGCASGGCSSCSAAAPAVDGVYMTDQLRDPEPFGERIDDGKLSREQAIAADKLAREQAIAGGLLTREEAIAAGLLTEDGAPAAPHAEETDAERVAAWDSSLGALRSSLDGARAFQAEADRDGYGR
jgi:hypothetical protein